MRPCHSCSRWVDPKHLNHIGLCPMCLLSYVVIPDNPVIEHYRANKMDTKLVATTNGSAYTTDCAAQVDLRQARLGMSRSVRVSIGLAGQAWQGLGRAALL